MDESFQDIEAELKSLAPRTPSLRVRDRIARELASANSVPASADVRYTTATDLSSWKWFGWRAVGFAAALAIVAAAGFVRFGRPTPTDSTVTPGPLTAARLPVRTHPVNSTQTDLYRPVAASNVLYDLKDEGPVTVEGDTAARRVRYRYVDTYTWKNSRSNAAITWSVPRDEIRVIPASLH